MSYADEVETAAANLVRDLREVRDAQLREATGRGDPNDLMLSLRTAAQKAGFSVRNTLELLKRVNKALEDVETNAQLVVGERRQRASAPSSIAAAPASTGPVPLYSLAAAMARGSPPVEVAGERVMPKSEQDLAYRRAARRHGRL